MSQVLSHGKAKIRIEARGCVDCGTEHSYGWESAGAVRFIANHGVQGHERVVMVAVHRCARCALRKPAPRPDPSGARLLKRGAA